MKKLQAPVLIVGAGPAGCAASFRLSQLNIPHILIDKAVFPRDKVCGDALSGKVVDALSTLAPDLMQRINQDEAHYTPTPGIRFYGPNYKHIDIPFPERKDGYKTGFVSKRMDFDNDLVQALNPEYCTFLQGCNVKQILRVNGEIQIRAASEQTDWELHAKTLIGADGPVSIVRKSFQEFESQTEDKHESAAVRAYFKGVTGFTSNMLELHFYKEALPGYFWIFPLPDGRANVGLGMLSNEIKKRKINLRALLIKLINETPGLAERFKNAELEGDIRGWKLPLGSRIDPIFTDNVLLAGDAAWLIDPFTGEGIGNAFVSGKMAAEHVANSLNNGDFSATSFRAYQTELLNKLQEELKLSHKLQQLSARPWLFNFLLKKAISNPALREMMTGMFSDLDLRSHLKKPSFYFKLLFR